MTWLVTGGAGYIGAHVVRSLLTAGEEVVVLDDLSTGTKDNLPAGVTLELGSVRDRAVVDRILAERSFDGVVHIAAKKQVGESVAKPLWYYEENVEGLRVLLEAVVAAGVKRFLFSSSAAVYGSPPTAVVTEDTATVPMSPYGETKMVGELLIRATSAAYGLSYVNLRYFNVAGAGAPELGDTGVFNLIPMIFEQLEAGNPPRIFGDDYDTPDGTCVRDYIHVADVADAHAAAVKRLLADEQVGLTLNIGRGEGVSVKQIVAAVRAETGIAIDPVVVARRPGDPDAYAADSGRITAELGWSAQHDLTEMVSSAWAGWRYRHDG
ncbi:MAG TPA: UDP-glucose 4-epimerase GalE [Actinocrinis sp.]|nr:UDP-glucose 4-epimerase GalE [Actinocrinis sp.]